MDSRDRTTRTARAGRAERMPDLVLGAGVALVIAGLALQPAGARQDPATAQDPPSPVVSAWGTADSNGAVVAVTGVDITGASLLYVIDSVQRRLSVYQAIGGGESTASLRWIGARNIDLDLQVNGYNDDSRLSYRDLERQFAAAPPGGGAGDVDGAAAKTD
jgi:hypothetical protein